MSSMTPTPSEAAGRAGVLLSMDDALAIGNMVADMADRAKAGQKIIPSARVEWSLTIDGTKFQVVVMVAEVARVSINLNHGDDGSPFYGENICNNLPLAICDAALRARAAS